MNLLHTTFLPILLLLSCAHSTRKQAPLPTTTMATASGKDLRTLQRGHTLYVSHCGRCHEPQLPATVNAADWHIVVPGMAWNAGLRKHQEQDVLHYILAAKTATP